MHIADVRTIPLSYHCETPYMSAAGVQTARHALLVEVETDNGLVGIGEAGSAGGPLVSTQVVVEHELKPLLLGEDPLRLEYLWQKMFPHSIGFSGGQLPSYVEGSSALDFPLIHDARSQDRP